MSKMKIYTDGASRGNPGHAGIGAIIYDENNEIIAEISRYLGETTNNVAEYTAMVTALEQAKALGATEVAVFTDSELLVKQVQGEYKVRNQGLIPLYLQVKALIREFTRFSLTHVPREQNREADKLANQGIDGRTN